MLKVDWDADMKHESEKKLGDQFLVQCAPNKPNNNNHLLTAVKSRRKDWLCKYSMRVYSARHSKAARRAPQKLGVAKNSSVNGGEREKRAGGRKFQLTNSLYVG